MTFKIICAECQQVLFESQEFQPLETILQSLNYVCPNCKRKIDNPTPKAILVNGKPLKFGNEPKPTVEPKKDKKWWRKGKER